MTTRHRALCVGAGRIGAGYKWIDTPYRYTHADAYLAIKDRVELVGFVEPDEERAHAAEKKYKLPVFSKLSFSLLEHQGIDIISVCTQPEQQAQTLLIASPIIKGAWIEKPYVCSHNWPFKAQINYIRRAERLHRSLKSVGCGHLTVWAKKNNHTASHFTDLARFWGLSKSQLTYNAIDGPNYYEWEYKTATPLNPNTKIRFEGGGLTDGFMETMCGNLLDAVDGKADLWSPPESAIESEKWANEILGDNK